MPLYEEKLISPLAIRFSQQRIRETFQDGRDVEATIKEIVALPGTGDYDIILDAPFPAIEIIRWAPNGRKSGGGENWFTFDNRRLYSLQRLAAEHWPKRVGAKVEVMYADAGTIRKKLDTKTEGLSVSIGHANASAGELTEWSWRKETNESACPWKPHMPAKAGIVADAAKTSVHDLMDVPALPVLPNSSEKLTPEPEPKTSGAESLSSLIGQLLHLKTTEHLPAQDHDSDVTTSSYRSEHVEPSDYDGSTVEFASTSPSSASCKEDILPVRDVDARPQPHMFSKGADVPKPKCPEESTKERLMKPARATRSSKAAKQQMAQQQLALCQMAQAAQWQQMAYATQMAQWQQAYACQAAQFQAAQATQWQQGQSAWAL